MKERSGHKGERLEMRIKRLSCALCITFPPKRLSNKSNTLLDDGLGSIWTPVKSEKEGNLQRYGSTDLKHTRFLRESNRPDLQLCRGFLVWHTKDLNQSAPNSIPLESSEYLTIQSTSFSLSVWTRGAGKILASSDLYNAFVLNSKNILNNGVQASCMTE